MEASHPSHSFSTKPSHKCIDGAAAAMRSRQCNSILVLSTLVLPLLPKHDCLFTSKAPAKGERLPPAVASRTALEHFEDFHAGRIDAAGQIPVNPFIFDLKYRSHSSLIPPVILYKRLEQLYSSDYGASEKDLKDLEDFFDDFQSCGGCILVEFEKDEDPQARTLECMWSTMEAFYARKAGVVEIDESILNQQYLPPIINSSGPEDEEQEQRGGYDFVQTFLDEDHVVPTTIQDSLLESTSDQKSRQKGVAGSFRMLADISKMVATVAASGAMKKSPAHIKRVVEDLLDGYSCCNHRLCQYLPSESNDIVPSSSLLRSHTDWSLVTSIPVSKTPGLLVYHTLKQEWMAPDMVITSQEPMDQNSQYCLVLAGKSLDLLIGSDTGLACIHQVMPLSSGKQRLSAPFFLRPKESISQQIREQYNQEPFSYSKSKGDANFGVHKVFKTLLDAHFSSKKTN